jgi:serpin B
MAVHARALGPPPAEPLPVEVDRPFLFVVGHPGTGSIYFLARVTDPS